MKYSPNGVLYTMPNTEKHVLSFVKDLENDNNVVDQGGWISINNPSDVVMDVFVSYMTTGPGPGKYPTVEATRNNRGRETYILDPKSIGWGDKSVHVSRLANVGKIYPGAVNDTVYFRALESHE